MLMMRRWYVVLGLIMALAMPAPTAAQADEIVTLAAVGDIMLARSIGAAMLRNPLDSPFAAVTDILQSADVTIGNLECAIATTGKPVRKAFTFRAPPQAVSALATTTAAAAGTFLACAAALPMGSPNCD